VNEEYYLLEGRIIKYLDQYYFEVDTEVHPYLVRNSKEDKVYYALKNPDKVKISFLNRKIRILVRAEGIIKAHPENNYYSYQILLHLLKNSVVLKKNISKQTESDLTKETI